MARRLIPGRLLGEAGRPPLTTCTAGRRHIPWRLDDERSWGLVDPSKRDGRGPPPLLVCLIVLEGLARCRRGRRNVVEEGARQLRKNQQGCTHAHYGTLGGAPPKEHFPEACPRTAQLVQRVPVGRSPRRTMRGYGHVPRLRRGSKVPRVSDHWRAPCCSFFVLHPCCWGPVGDAEAFFSVQVGSEHDNVPVASGGREKKVFW